MVWLEQSQKEKNVRDRTEEGTKKGLWDILGQHGNLGFTPNIASLVVT